MEFVLHIEFCDTGSGGEHMIKVASYCRVSTDKDDQANSFEAQQRYFKEYIDRQPDWELYEVYADEAVIIGLKTVRLIKCQKHGAF